MYATLNQEAKQNEIQDFSISNPPAEFDVDNGEVIADFTDDLVNLGFIERPD